MPVSKFTPLHVTCTVKNKDDAQAKLSVVKYLIEEQHADWQLKVNTGHTAADLAKEANNVHIESYLKGIEQEQAKRRKQAKEKNEDAEKLRIAAVAADQAAAAAATAAKQAKARNALAAKKRKKARKQAAKKDQQKQEEEQEKEQNEADNLGMASSSLGAVTVAMGDISIEEPALVKEAPTAAGFLKASETDDADAFEEFLLENAPDALICPISFRLLTDPVLAQDTHTYDRRSLEQWMERCKAKCQEIISPKNNLPMAEWLTSNQIVRTMALDFMEAKKKEWEETGGGKMKG
jgi:hypothetical protein